MAAALPNPEVKTTSIAKGIYRFLANCRFGWQVLLEPLYRKASGLFVEQKEVLGIIDLSPVEKPYARQMEGLGQVMKNDRSGTTNGYMDISILLSGAGKIGLAYSKLFSHQCELMSQNQEIGLGMVETRRLLPASTKIIWVWDRGFDDQKNYQRVLAWRDKFVGRVYQNRTVLVGGEECGLLTWGRDLPIRVRFSAKLSFWGRLRRVRIGLSWGQFEFKGHHLWLLCAWLLWVEGIEMAKLKDCEWWLVTNICITGNEVARKIWRYYRRRWEIESFFKFLKHGLGLEEFQVLELEEIRRVVALVIIGALFIYKFSDAIDDKSTKILLGLGGWTGCGKPGKIVLKRGLAVFLSYLFVDSFLKSHEFS